MSVEVNSFTLTSAQQLLDEKNDGSISTRAQQLVQDLSSISTRTEQLLAEKDSQIAELRANLEKTQKFLAAVVVAVSFNRDYDDLRYAMKHKLLSDEKTRYSPLIFEVPNGNAMVGIHLVQGVPNDNIDESYDDSSSEE